MEANKEQLQAMAADLLSHHDEVQCLGTAEDLQLWFERDKAAADEHGRKNGYKVLVLTKDGILNPDQEENINVKPDAEKVNAGEGNTSSPEADTDGDGAANTESPVGAEGDCKAGDSETKDDGITNLDEPKDDFSKEEVSVGNDADGAGEGVSSPAETATAGEGTLNTEPPAITPMPKGKGK